MPRGSVISLEHTISLIAWLTVPFDTFCIIACHLINYVRVIEELSQNSSQPNEVTEISCHLLLDFRAFLGSYH